MGKRGIELVEDWKIRLINLFKDNCCALLWGAGGLVAVITSANLEVAYFQIPGFTWAFVCLAIILLELFDIKLSWAIHAKYSPVRQIWVLACLAIPMLLLHPWSGSIEVNNKLEYIVGITSLLFLVFYQAFLSMRSLILRKASDLLSVLGEITITIVFSLAFICFTLLYVMGKILFDGSGDNERYAIQALFIAFLLFSLLASFVWHKLVSQGALVDQRAFLLSQRTIAILELALASISVLLIGDATLASYGKGHIIDSSASLALYVGAIVLLSCLVPLKLSSYSKKTTKETELNLFQK